MSVATHAADFLRGIFPDSSASYRVRRRQLCRLLIDCENLSGTGDAHILIPVN